MSKVAVVTLKVVHKSSRYPKGAFEAFYNNGSGAKSKQCALHVHDADIAYQTVDLWAEDVSKSLGYEYVKTSQAVLQKYIDENVARPYGSSNGVTGKKVTTPNKSILSNVLYFKAELNRVFQERGFEKLKEMLKVGTAHLETLEADRKASTENLDTAKKNMAISMYQTYLDTGVNMSEFCNDAEIIAEFNAYRLEPTKLI